MECACCMLLDTHMFLWEEGWNLRLLYLLFNICSKEK